MLWLLARQLAGFFVPVRKFIGGALAQTKLATAALSWPARCPSSSAKVCVSSASALFSW